LAGRADREVLRPYVPRLLGDWLAHTPDAVHRTIEGTAMFADLSGFTQLTERLARHGKIGAEEMSDALDATFTELLGVADGQGADLVKWGGDAVVLLFEGPDHEARACTAAHGMRARLRKVGRLTTSAGSANLRMSVGIRRGEFHFFLVGDPALHRELVICGPDVTRLVELEGLAHAGEIAVDEDAVAEVGDEWFGAPVSDLGRLLRRSPGVPARELVHERSSVDLSGFVPEKIREHLLLGAGEPEHRTIAVAFVQFMGTDAMLRDEGPAATAEALHAVVSSVAQAAAEFDVSFHESDVNADGGKIMLTAGAPRSSGHDVDRMLRAMRRAMDRMGRIPLRVGINAGPVFAGDFGPPFRRTYSVKGDAINLAARVMGKAEPGQVLVTAGAHEHSATQFELERLEPFKVKGKAHTVQAFAVGRVLEGRQPAPVGGPGGRLVGRDDELGVLTGMLEHLRSREGGAVEILGEPGIGKSRLMAEMARLATDLTVLSVVCDEYAASTPYHAFRGLLRDLTGVREDTDPALAAQRISDRVVFDAPSLVPWLPLLSAPLGLAIPDTPQTEGLEDQFRKRRLEEVVGEFLHALLPTPTLVVIDDAQHMDGASVDLLSALTARLGAEQWLFVVGRRDRPVGWVPPEELAITSLRLQPLTSEDSLTLVREASEVPLPRPTLEALAARADGNPLFLESLISAADPSGSVEDLPSSVQELVTTQIDQLSPGDRALLRHASVLGMRFEAVDLQRLTTGTSSTPTPATFDRLREFLVQDSATLLRFRHAMFRDVAYEGLPYRRRQRLHQEVGTAIEQGVLAGQQGPEALSMHFFHARDFDRAWRYSCTAGHRALETYANHDATEFFRRAIESERRERGLVAPHELGEVVQTLADTLYTIGHLEQAARTYKEAERLFSDDPARAGMVVAKQADVERRLRRLPQSLRRITVALRRLDVEDGRRETNIARAHLAMRYALSRFTQGQIDDALAWGDRAAREAEESTDKATLAQAYATLHGIYVATHREADLPYGELALEAYDELGNVSGQGRCLNNLAIAAHDGNRWVEAVSMLGRAAELYRRIGDTAAETNSLFNRAEIMVRQGHWAEAKQLFEEVVVAARSVSDDELVAMTLREAGRNAARAGDVADALVVLQQARAAFAEIDETEELPATDAAIAEALMRNGDTDEALALSAPLTAEPELAASMHWVRGQALLAEQHVDEAAAEFERGIAVAAREDDLYAGALNTIGLAGVRPGTDSAGARATLTSLGVVSLPQRSPQAVPA
jgi:predicted ATPase/class 3 adenylate cyclase